MKMTDPIKNENSSSEEKKPLTYLESIEQLSKLDFETSTIVNDETPHDVATATQMVAVIFQKDFAQVMSDLIDKRQEEIDDEIIDDELRYGHLGQGER
jgi:hypothetical protein